MQIPSPQSVLNNTAQYNANMRSKATEVIASALRAKRDVVHTEPFTLALYLSSKLMPLVKQLLTDAGYTVKELKEVPCGYNEYCLKATLVIPYRSPLTNRG